MTHAAPDPPVQPLAVRGLWLVLAVIFIAIGLQKLTAYEAAAVAPIAARSPFLGWTYGLLGERGAAVLFAAVEVPTGLGLALGAFRPSALVPRAAAAAAVTSLITTSFVLTTPGAFVREGALPLLSLGIGQLFIKDAVLVAAAVVLLGAGDRAARS